MSFSSDRTNISRLSLTLLMSSIITEDTVSIKAAFGAVKSARACSTARVSGMMFLRLKASLISFVNSPDDVDVAT